MNIIVELSEADLQLLVCKHIAEKTGQPVTPGRVEIEVKSKQNYKSEWEKASYRARYLASL